MPYLAARQRGEASGREWPKEAHRAMHRYLVACLEHSQRLTEAGVPRRSWGDVLRECRAEWARRNAQSANGDLEVHVRVHA